jgi:uncharacterized membrane protein YidH (DUF202 family)
MILSKNLFLNHIRLKKPNNHNAYVGLNNRSSFLGILLGVFLIVVGVLVAVATITGFISHFLPPEIASAASPYMIGVHALGVVIACFLVVFGLFICWASSRN